MATALLTGGTGLIGSLLRRSWDLTDLKLTAVGRDGCDLLTPGVPTRMVRALSPTMVIHLAWCASGRPDYRSSGENERWVAASLELHEACVEAGADLIATGTVVDRASDGADAYTAAKAALRQALLDEISRGDVTWLRPHFVFAPGKGRPRLVADALAAAGRGHAVELANPTALHDFIHVEDVAAAIVAAVRHGLSGEIDVGSGVARSVSSLVEAMGVEWVSRSTTETRGHEADVADLSALSPTGWTPIATDRFFELNKGAP